MKQFDLYGFNDLSIEDATRFVEEALGIQFTLHDSSYRGIYYASDLNALQGYMIQNNREEARWYKEYPEYSVTLMVNDLPEMNLIREKLTADKSHAVFLRTKTVFNE